MSVTRPPKISMGASNDPAVVIFLYLYLSVWYIARLQVRFGECFQWGYWTRLTSVEGCFAAPGVRVSHSPLSPSTRLTVSPAALYLNCLSGVSSTRLYFGR